MTYENAYRWLHVHFAPCGDGTKQDDAISTALKALKKQIPKQSIKNDPIINPAWVKDAMLCPECHSWVGSLKFCSKCGQAVEWGGRRNE